MVKTKQPFLPKLSRVKIVKKGRMLPQPRVDEFKAIRQYELFHRPFDLRFRGRVHKWLDRISKQKLFKIKEVLDYRQYKVVRLYFFPQKPNNKWLSQKEVLEITNKRSYKRLKSQLVSALIRIWKREKQ